MPAIIQPTWKRLADAIEAADLRQQDVAEACNVTQAAVSLWIQGKRIPERRQLHALASLLKDYLSLEDLVADAASFFVAKNITFE